MCRQRIITYSCPEPCDYSALVWDSHCQYTGLDNMQGECGHVDMGDPETMPYPCREHRGLGNPEHAPFIIGARGAELNHPTWTDSLDPETHSPYQMSRALAAQRRRWIQQPDRYERDPDMPNNLNTMDRGEWLVHHNNIFNTHVDETWGALYDADTMPWGRAREGGPLNLETENSRATLNDIGLRPIPGLEPTDESILIRQILAQRAHPDMGPTIPGLGITEDEREEILAHQAQAQGVRPGMPPGYHPAMGPIFGVDPEEDEEEEEELYY